MIRSWVGVGQAILVLAAGAMTLADEDPRAPFFLRYSHRSVLRADDFRAPVPEQRPEEELPIEAYSHTVVRYDYQPRIRRRGRTYVAEAFDFQVDAVFEQDKSWNALPDSAALLEHHQGHFDLAKITALEIERQWEAMQKTPERLRGRGTTEALAAEDLREQVAKFLAGHFKSLERDHKYFDQVTRYGTLSETEARERAKHQQLLRSYQSPSTADQP